MAAVLRPCLGHGPPAAAADRQRAGAAARRSTTGLTDGGDNQRTGWNKQEKTLTKDNVKNLKLLWKLETGNQVRALHSLMPVLVVGQLRHAGGRRNRSGSSPASPTTSMRSTSTPARSSGRSTGTIRRRPAAAAAVAAVRRRPGSARTSASFGPAAAATRRSSVRRTRRVAGRFISSPATACCTCSMPPPARISSRAFMFHTGKGWSLNLVGNVIWMANTYAGDSISAVQLDDPQHKVMNFNAGSGGAWGRRGAVIDSTGTAWTTTGDGVYDPDQRSAALRQQRHRRADRRRRAQAEGLLHARPTGTGCASAISIRTTRRRSSPTRDAS